MMVTMAHAARVGSPVVAIGGPAAGIISSSSCRVFSWDCFYVLPLFTPLTPHGFFERCLVCMDNIRHLYP